MISKSSNHSWSYKLATVRCICWQTVTIQFNIEDLNNEISVIKLIAVHNDDTRDKQEIMKQKINKKVCDIE